MHAMIVDLFSHMEWADATVWRAVLAHRVTAGDSKLRDALLHLHSVQKAFFFIWTSAPMQIPEAQSFEDAAAICRWGRAYYRDAPSWIAAAEDLHRIVVLPWSKHLVERFGAVHDTTLGETMIQVTSHSTYHRGQVNARLRELGGEPPLVDYIAWLWLGRPAAHWPDD
jgi:uncharacterized damage-inducible protein DinB